MKDTACPDNMVARASSLLERRKRPPLLPVPWGAAKGGYPCQDSQQDSQPLPSQQSVEAFSDTADYTTAESGNGTPCASPGISPVALAPRAKSEEASTASENDVVVLGDNFSHWVPAESPSLPCKVRCEEATNSLRVRRKFLSRPQIDCQLVQAAAEQSDPWMHQQCPRLSDRYEGFEKLGEGSCGVVYRVRSKTDNKDVAIKVMRMNDEERLNIARREYDVLRQVSHPNIIKAIDFFKYSQGAVLVLDYFPGKKLARAVRDAPGRRLPECTAQQLSIQLLGAIAKLHECDIIHRDVKADNILVSHDLTDLRLVDFNAAKHLAEGAPLTMTGTIDYMPPEVIYGDSPSQASDIWGAGLCVYTMLDGRLPSEWRSLRPRLLNFTQANLQPGPLVRLEGEKWEHLSEPCKETVMALLENCHDSRVTAADVMARPWLAPVELEPSPTSC